MTITLSIDAMLSQIYARSAMIWLAAPGAEKPEVLSPDHELALRELIRGAFAGVIARFLRVIRSTNLGEVDIATDPLLILDMTLPAAADPTAVRAALENVVAMTALAGAVGTADNATIASYADAILAEAVESIHFLEANAIITSALNARIHPSWC